MIRLAHKLLFAFACATVECAVTTALMIIEDWISRPDAPMIGFEFKFFLIMLAFRIYLGNPIWVVMIHELVERASAGGRHHFALISSNVLGMAISLLIGTALLGLDFSTLPRSSMGLFLFIAAALSPLALARTRLGGFLKDEGVARATPPSKIA